MSALSASQHTEPLGHDEMQLADRATRRLHESFRGFLAGLPREDRNASGLARFLDVDRTTCQRLVFIASRPYAGLGCVERLPGVRGLRQITRAARRQGETISEEAISGLESATDRYEQMLKRLAGSQSGLVRRLSVTPNDAADATAGNGGEDRIPARQRLFETAAELTGRYSETWVAVYMYSPNVDSDDPAHAIKVARAHGLIGHRARANAVPLTFHNFTSKRTEAGRHTTDGEVVEGDQQSFRSLSETPPTDRTPDTVLTDFSTDPAPVVSSRQPGEYLVQSIDTDPGANNHAIDLVLGTRNTMPHPGLQPPGIAEVWALINFPVRRMVFDVYLHRDLARECIPGLDQHLWRPDFAANVRDRWQTRFAEGPRLELLGQGIAGAATPSYARHEELTNFLFRQTRAAPERFIGYRCAVEYPVWRTGYCMSFDFNASDEA